MEKWDEALFELIYDQPLSKSNGKHPYNVNLQGHQKIDELDIQVALYDEDGIKDVAVIANEQPESNPLDGFGLRSGARPGMGEPLVGMGMGFGGMGFAGIGFAAPEDSGADINIAAFHHHVSDVILNVVELLMNSR